jgi:hypothetical protein
MGLVTTAWNNAVCPLFFTVSSQELFLTDLNAFVLGL